MTTNSAGKWIGYGVGDADDTTLARNAANWHAVSLINQKLHDHFTWARDLGVTTPKPVYDAVTAAAIAEFCQRVGITPTLDANGYAVATFAVRTRLGSYPPPPPPTHAMLTIRGTGGIIGQDYTSLIAAASPTHHEVPVNYSASMGGIPVAAATDPEAPSGDDAAEQAYQLGVQWLESTTASFSIAAYSLGSKGAVMLLNDIWTPGGPLNKYQDRFVCAVMVADPWRPFGHTFFLGPIPDGQGIGAPYYTMNPDAVAALGWRCCWLANPTDLYTNSPLGATGQVLADVEQIVLEMAISDPFGSIQRAIPYLLQILEKDGGLQSLIPGGASSLLSAVAGGSMVLTTGLVGLLAPLLMSAFQGLIAGISGNGSNLPPGPAADVQAAILALKFYGSGIAGHVSYHSTPWSPNSPQTYLELGIQHANDWGSRIPVLQ